MKRKSKQAEPNAAEDTEQSQKWITDLDMWQSTLDVHEDDSIDYSLISDAESGHEASNSVNKSQQTNPPKQKKIEKRRQVVRPSMKQTKALGKENKVNHNTGKPPSSKKKTIKNKEKHLSHSDREVPKVNKNSETPVGNSKNRRNLATTRPEKPASPPSTAPLAKPRPRAASDRVPVLQPDSDTQRRVAESVPHQSSGNQRRSHQQRNNASAQVKAKPNLNNQDARSQKVAVFTASEPCQNVNVQDVSAVMKQLKYEKYLNIAKVCARFLIMHWVVISATVVSFSLGYYLGAANHSAALTPKLEKNQVKTVPSINAPVTMNEVAEPNKKARAANQPKPKLKPKPEPKVVAPQIAEPIPSKPKPLEPATTTINEVVLPKNRSVTDIPSSETNEAPELQAQQFEGKEIPLEDTSTSDVSEVALPEANLPADITSDPLSNLLSNPLLDEQVDVLPNANEPAFDDELSDLAPSITEPEPGDLVEDPIAVVQQPLPETPQTEESKLQSLLAENLAKLENKEWQAVINISTEILTLYPQATAALINRSVAYTELGMFSLAIKDASRAMEIEPDNALAYNNRGYAYERMVDYERAIEDYQAACDLGIELSCLEADGLRAKFVKQ